jgi:hypothetical protein
MWFISANLSAIDYQPGSVFTAPKDRAFVRGRMMGADICDLFERHWVPGNRSIGA